MTISTKVPGKVVELQTPALVKVRGVPLLRESFADVPSRSACAQEC